MQNIIDRNYAKRYFNVAKFDIRNNFEVKLGVSFNPFKLWTRVQLPASFLNYQTVRIGSLLFHSRVWKYARERATTTYIATAWLIDRNNGGHPSPLHRPNLCTIQRFTATIRFRARIDCTPSAIADGKIYTEAYMGVCRQVNKSHMAFFPRVIPR